MEGGAHRLRVQRAHLGARSLHALDPLVEVNLP